MSFYRTCMRCASPILFWVAVLTFVMTLLFSLLQDWTLLRWSVAPAYGGDREPIIVHVISSIAAAFSSAVWPFLGSALIWHLNGRPSGSKPEAAE